MRLSQGLLSVWLAVCCCAPAVAETRPAECYQHAAALYRAANWSAAAGALSDFIRRFPDDPQSLEARFYLGEAHLQASQLAQARASYRAFVDQLGGRRHDDEATARFRIGETSFLLHDQADAESALREFCDRYPSHSLVTYALPYRAELALARGDYQEVLQIADRQLSAGCRRPFETHLIIARCYRAMGQFQAARNACNKVDRDGRSEFDLVAKARLMAAETYAQQSQWQAAVRAYQRLAALRPHPHVTTPSSYRADALLAAAECYQKMGEIQLAKQTYATVLLEFPRSEGSQTATARLASLAGRTT